MKNLFKKNVGLIIALILIFAFPTSLSNQARLNMRVIVTGLAIDKSDEGFEVTAQIVKTSPGAESGGTSAEVNFLSDTDTTLLGAISKLSYKAGKVASFSHTNFIVIGEELAKSSNLVNCLNYFVRDRIIKNTALILFSEGKASDEIQKTKDVELSVGLGLQKVYLFKERESDGVMHTVLEFLNESSMYSKTTTASTLKLISESEKSSQKEGSSSGTETGSSGSSSGSSGGSSDGSESQSSSGSSGESYQYFEDLSPLVCFVGGEYKGKLEGEEALGFMFADKHAVSDDFSLENVEIEKLGKVTVGVKMKAKTNKYKIRYENEIPCFDLTVTIEKSEIEEIQAQDPTAQLSESEYTEIKKALKEDINKKVAKAFEKAKGFGADVFGAYELAYKTKFKETIKYYETPEEFLKNLKLNVEVNVEALEY